MYDNSMAYGPGMHERTRALGPLPPRVTMTTGVTHDQTEESFQNSLCLRVKRSVRSTMSKKAWILSIFQPLLQLMLLFLHSASTAPATPFVQSSSGLSSTAFGVAVTLTCNMTQISSSLKYSWRLNGSTVQTATSSNTYLVDGDDTAADSGSYVCVAEDGTGSASSPTFSFTVSSIPATPVITHNPVTYGDTVTLTCSTASVGNLTYEFFANNVSVSSTSSNIYLIGQVTFASESTSYTCAVSHSSSPSEKSTAFHLTVKPNKPSIIDSGNREDGASLSLTCVSTIDSSTVLAYYWYKDTNLTNHFLDQQTVTFNSLTFSDSGNYRCEATHGSVVSDKSDPEAVIVKPQTPKVTVNTSSSSVEEGSPVALVCQTKSITSSRTVTYTWFDDSSNIISGPLASDTLVKSTTNFASAGLYLCSISIDGIPSDLSAEFQLTVQPQAPHVSLLQALPLTDLDTVTLECSSPSVGQNTAGQTLQYTWYIPSGMSTSSQSGRTFTFNVTLAAEGSYTCQVTRNGVASSIGAALNVTVRPRRPSVAPAGEALVDGAQVNLTCNTASTPSTGQPFTYQWLKDGTSTGVTTVRDFALSSLDFSKEGYYTCIVYHKGIPSQSSFAYLLKVQPRRPVVSGQPRMQESKAVTLTCTSPSTGLLDPITYRWSFNDFNTDQVLADANQIYTITSATFAMTGDYSCSVASNGTFSDPSDSYRLEVTPQTPTITSSSADAQPILDQSSVSLMCVTASQPTGVELYTWYFKGIVQTSETSVYYNISTVSFAQAGDYNCSVKYDAVASDVSPSYVISVKPQTPTLQLDGTPVDGSALTLTCTTPSTLPSADPSRVSYVWSRANIISSRYTFKPTLSDNGDYTCSVMFDSVSSESSVSSTIKVRPLTPTVAGATEIQESENVTLTCSTASQIPISSAVSYTWYGVSGSAISSVSTDTYSISLASYAASGSYSCEVTYDTAASNRSAAHFLKVKPMTPVISNDENPVLDGGNTTLNCTTSSPGDSYKWFDITGSLIASQSSSTYQISPVTMAKRGSYRCLVVYNSIESNKSDPPFVLQVKPKAPAVSVSGKPAIDQSPVTLDCSSQSVTASASPTYKWFTNSGTEISQENKKQYTISDVTFSVPKSSFQCSVTLNSIESNKSVVFSLEVKPQTPIITGSSMVVEGSGIALSCDTASTSMPSSVVWAWFRDGSSIAGVSSQQYTSARAIFSDMAAYTCTVSTDGVQSLSSSAFYLSVQPKPATLTGNASMPLYDGSPFSLQCSTESSPIDNMTYTFTNADTGVVLATNVTDSSYFLGTVTLETSGSYTCKVTHKGVNSNVSSPPLVLSVKPQTPVVVNSNAQSTEGTDVSLTCSTPSDLSSASGGVIFMWVTPSGNKNLSSQSLTLWRLTFADVGAYSCAVTYRGVESDRSADYTLQVIPPAPVVSGVTVATQSSSITYTCTTTFASTPSTLTYEWYKDASLLTGSTSANLIISPALFSSMGAYKCVVTANGVKSDFSQPLSLTVKPQTPTVIAENILPVPEGGNVSMTCRTASEKLMTGSVAFTFYDPSDLIVAANVSNKTFTLTSMTLARAGNYKCKVIYNGVSSDVSTTPLLVTVKPAQPQVQTTAVLPVEEGQSLTLSCQTSSSMPAGGVVAYSWRQSGGSVIAGAVSATYTLSDVSFAKAGGYQCQVSCNALPSEYSAVFTVTVKPATPFLSGLTAGQVGSSLSLTCSSLSSVDFIVLVTSPGETVIKNLTSNPLTFMPLKLSDAGRYKCRVAKAGVESAYSSDIQLTVQPRAPTLFIYPTSTVADGSSATFTCNSSSQSEMAAEGYNTTLYHSNGATFTSVSPPTATWPYVITASTAQAGQYACSVTYRQVESSKSSVVNLLVKPATPVVSLVQAVAVDGSAVSLQCGTSNQTGLSSRWTKNSVFSTTSNNTFLAFPTVTFADTGIYSCMLTLNTINSDYSTTGYSLVVKPMSPVITGALTVEEGSALNLTCQPQSSGMPTPVTYSWSRGVTTQILHIDAVQFSDAGPITCKVSANGIDSSSVASVMVQVKTPSLTGPAGLSTIAVDDGSGSLTLNCATASQVTPITVTWYGDDFVIQGQSSASYTITSPSLASSSSVKCSMTYSSVESAKSNTILLQVRPRQPVLTGPTTAVATNISVTLTCSSASKPPGNATLTFSWKKDATTLRGETGVNLVISPAATSATGQYTCAATYLNVTSLDSSAFRLTVQDPPAQPTIKPSSLLVSVGIKVNLTCETTSTPVTTFIYSWSKDGVSLVASGQTFTIDQLKSSDAGAYTCAVVDNSVTSATSSAYQLTVVAPPSKPTVSVSPAAITISRQVNVTCDVSPVQPSFTYSWTFNGSALTNTSQTIVITSFQEANVGFYTCVVTFGTQQNASDPRLVATIYAPQSLSLTPAITATSLVEGDSLTVTCAAACSPTCTFQWSKSGTNTPVSSVLQLSLDVTAQSAGIYTCTASNSQGWQTIAFNLSVLATPITPSLSALPSTFTSGQLVTLTCSSTTTTANASLTYTWLQNDGVLQGQTAPVLQITSFSNEHTGRYVCKAVVASRVSSSSNILELAPSDAPGKPTVTLYPDVPVENAGVQFSCNATGSSYHWFYNGEVVANQTEQNYTISTVTLANQGSYTCDVISGAQLLRSLRSDAISLTIRYGPSAERVVVRANFSSEAQTLSLAQDGTYNVPPGTLGVMTCSASCSEACWYEWYKDSKSMAEEATLTQNFTQVQQGEGNYSCKATNSIDSYSVAFYIRISGSAGMVTASYALALVLSTIVFLFNCNVIENLRWPFSAEA